MKTAKRKLDGWIKLLDPRHIAAGKLWYVEARTFCQELSIRFGISPEKATGVVAALSPGIAWEANKLMAERLLSAWEDGEPAKGLQAYRAQIEKAYAILDGAPLPDALGPTAWKTRAFYANMTGDTSSVAIDRWILRALGRGDDVKTHTERLHVYNSFVELFIVAARGIGLAPCELQAAVWLCIQDNFAGDVAGALRWSLRQNVVTLGGVPF
jgi:hypothetical protein